MTTITLDIVQNSANAITALSFDVYTGYFGAEVDDTNLTSTIKTWSASKQNSLVANTNSFIRTKMSVANSNATLANTNSWIKSQLANTNSFIKTKMSVANSNATLANTNSWIKSQLANTNSWIGRINASILTSNTALYVLGLSRGTITSNAPILNLSETWNNGAVTFTGLKYNATDTASAAASLLMDLQVGGVSKFSVRKDGLTTIASSLSVGGNFFYGWLEAPSSGRLGFSDAQLWRDAANVLAQRNGVNAQAFRLYNTFTDASNYERGFASWSTNLFQIGTEKAGTGVARNVQFLRDGLTHLTLSGSLTVGNVNFLFATDNAYDIGASGANRPRNVYVGSSLVASANLIAGSGYLIGWNGRGGLQAQSDGVVTIFNNAGTNFGRLQFGGTTSSFPALKRNTDQLEARLADDSDYTPFVAQRFSMVDGVTEPAATVGQAKLYVDAADGDLKVKFGDGTVKTIVTDT